ncbi:hypothetical protein QYF36_011657 [Acer negundo]|nr:hypothetical protein QYF36_011657 [Acer negundo]
MSRKMDTSPGLSRLIWVDVYGVLIDYWCKDFFKRLRGQLGETVWVNEDIIRKTIIDIGRILILVPFDEKISSEINVKGIHGVFSVRLEEATLQVSTDWLNLFLGLKPLEKMDTSPRTKVGEEWGFSGSSGFQASRKGRENEQGINLYIDLRGQDSGDSRMSSGNDRIMEIVRFLPALVNSEFVTMRRKLGRLEKNQKGRGLDSIVKSHPMKTRRSKLPQPNSSSRQKRLKKRVKSSQGREKEQGINLCIDLRGQDSGDSRMSSGNDRIMEIVRFLPALVNSEFVTMRRKLGLLEKNQKGRGLDSIVKSHPMKTRRSKLP